MRNSIRSILLSIVLMGAIGLMSSTYAKTGDCTQWAGGTLSNGQTVYGYSSVLWQITGQNYTNCAPFSGKLSCVNGVINGNPGFYTYTQAQCQAGKAKSCSLPRWAKLAHGQSVDGYSATGVDYPKSCSAGSTKLSCVNGNLKGNRQVFQYKSCTVGNKPANGVDLSLSDSAGVAGQTTTLSQWSNPTLSLSIANKGNKTVNTSVKAGFVSCTWTDKQNIIVYSSPAITSLVINAGTKVPLIIQLKDVFTQSLGQKTLVCKMDMSKGTVGDVQANNNSWTQVYEVLSPERFDLAMERSISSIKQHLESASPGVGTASIQSFVFDKIMSILLPLIVVVGILIGLLGFYKVMFSSEEKAVAEGSRYIIYGVIGIIVIVSAKFIGNSIVDILSTNDVKGFQIAKDLYDKILYPFIKFAMYLALGAMFIILLSRVITFVFGSDADAKKKAGTLIGWNVIGMLVIIGAKQIVEAVYGKQASVVKDVSNLGEIGTGILADKNIPLIYQVVNRVLGLASLIVLVMIIVQTIQLLMKPDDAKQLTSIKNTLIYVFIGILVIGAGYLIVNFLIVN